MSGRLSLLHNRHLGKREFKVANGPPLNQMDLAFLKQETVIGMNKIFLGLKRFKLYPRYYAAVNQKVIEQSADQIRRLNCVEFVSQRSQAVIPEDALTYHINTENPPNRFCRDITNGVHEGWTVTYAALQIAYYLGFNQAVWLGLDHRYEYTVKPNESNILEGPDPSHFDASYFDGGQSWNNPELDRSEESYAIARDIFTADGRQILDATINGACSVFKKLDLNNLNQANCA